MTHNRFFELPSLNSSSPHTAESESPIKVPVSIIIPIGPGEQCWRHLLSQIAQWNFSLEVICVFADVDRQPTEIEGHDLFDKGANVGPRIRNVVSETGRARQMNAGAREASESLLWFLHADSRVDAVAASAIIAAGERAPHALHYLKLKFDGDGPSMIALNSWGTWFRSRVLRLPFGDQGFLLSHRLFKQLGEYDPLAPFGEDHLLVWRAHQHKVPVRQATGTIITSARKYADRGWLKTTRQHLIGTIRQAFPEWIKLWRNRLMARRPRWSPYSEKS